MTWYRSLYWRIAIGVVAFLAAMLVVQAMLFVWAVSQTGRTLPGQSPGRLGMTVALDLANVLERDAADRSHQVHARSVQAVQPSVLRHDGRRPVHHERQRLVSRTADSMARARLERALRSRAVRSAGPQPTDRDRTVRAGSTARSTPAPTGGSSPTVSPTASSATRAAIRFVRPSPIVVHGQTRRRRRRPAAGAVRLSAPPVRTDPRAGRRRRADPRNRAHLGDDLRAGAPAAARARGRGTAARRRAIWPRARPTEAATKSRRSRSAFNAMADDLSARAEALAASDRARRQLLADVSHELNTPVTAMRGYLETLDDAEIAAGRGRRVRGIWRSSATRRRASNA